MGKESGESGGQADSEGEKDEPDDGLGGAADSENDDHDPDRKKTQLPWLGVQFQMPGPDVPETDMDSGTIASDESDNDKTARARREIEEAEAVVSVEDWRRRRRQRLLC